MSDNNTQREIDEFSGIETTGHEWDGIKELNNPLPRWWLWTFYATIVFSVGYVIYYPAIPLLNSSSVGVSGITNRGLVEEELRSAKAAQAVLLEKLAKTPLENVRSDNALQRFALAGGKSNFKVYCSQCHGSGASGSPGYPNLNDDDWLWGGDLAAIYTTIAHGVRDTSDEDARDSQMPAFEADEVLELPQIREVAEYVLKLSNRKHDATQAGKGEAIFAEQCASCHGDDGKGGREFGAPNLADALSLYGGTRDALVAQIRAPKHGMMPAWLARLGEARVKQLAIYVHSLGGGEKPKPAED